MHLFVDISAHGFGHLAITAPVIRQLGERIPHLRLSLRSALPETILRERIRLDFTHFQGSSDFGFVMHDSTRVDLPASLAAYRAAHADWPARVAAEAQWLETLKPDRVLTNVSYLPLAAAAGLGIPSASLCSLNWADLFAHFFADDAHDAPIHGEMLAAYRAADLFLRPSPGMPMPSLPRCRPVGTIAALGKRHDLGLGKDKAVLLAMGGITHRLPVDRWPERPGIRWLTPRSWRCRHPQAMDWESFALDFTDLLSSVDAVVTKPGYGTFTEAACNGTPVLYQRREDWPEQESLIAWLQENGQCREIPADHLQEGNLLEALQLLWAQPRPCRPAPDGALEAACVLAEWIGATSPRTASRSA